MPAFGLLDQLQVGDTGPAESTRRGNLQRVGLLFLGSRDRSNDLIDFRSNTDPDPKHCSPPSPRPPPRKPVCNQPLSVLTEACLAEVVPSGISAGIDAGGSGLGQGAQAAAWNRVSRGSYSVSLIKRPNYQFRDKIIGTCVFSY